MLLKKAVQYYNGPETCVSPLWRRIASTFQAQFLARVEDEGEWSDAKLYVKERRPEGGLEESDLEDYLNGSRRQLVVVTGPGGLGKTTFLRHVIRSYTTRGDFAVVWVDVLCDLPLPEIESFTSQVAVLISAGLERAVARGTDAWSWIRFFLANHADPAGLSMVVLRELEDSGALGPVSRDSLQHLLRRAEVSELIRLRFRYLRTVLQRTPVVVIDNVDHLQARAIEALVGLAFAFAEGPSTVTAGGADGSAKVVLAMRPLTHAIAQRGVGPILQRDLFSPDIALVLQRRLDYFLEAYDKKILPGATLPLSRGTSIKLRELNDADPDVIPETMARDLLRQLTHVMFSASTPHGDIISLVLRLNNYSTRVSLLATAQYVASGHIDWSGLFSAAHHRRNVNSYLTWPKVLRAMFMGLRAVYRSDAGWLYNLFNDGEVDPTSAVIRARFLRVLAGERTGLSASAIADVLARLFGYPEARVAKVRSDAQDRGLIHEATNERFSITDAGTAYLTAMIGEFEYLQHVVMDAWVDGDHLVPAASDEAAEIRYRRVLMFAAWVREIEVDEYGCVLRSGLEKLYERYYGEDTLSGAMCACLIATERVRHAIANEALASLQERTRELAARCELGSIRTEALARQAPPE